MDAGSGARIRQLEAAPFAPIVTGRMGADLPLNTLKVPPGFKVERWVDGVPMGRSLAIGDKGTLFVGSRSARTSWLSSPKTANAR